MRKRKVRARDRKSDTSRVARAGRIRWLRRNRKNDIRERIVAYALIQEGGSSGELYLHVHNTREEAEAFRVNCADGAYRTTEPVELPDDTDWDAVETLLQSVPTLDYP